MIRKIKIEIENRLSVIAVLLDEQAPETCEKIWQSLPLQGKLMHGIVTGREVFLPLNNKLEILPENQTIYPIEGDLCYYYKPAHYVYLETPMAEREIEVISLVYGRDTQMFGPVLPLPVNHFATLESDKDNLVKKISYMRLHGFNVMTITRLV